MFNKVVVKMNNLFRNRVGFGHLVAPSWGRTRPYFKINRIGLNELARTSRFPN